MSRFTKRDALGIWVKGYANNDETATHFPYYEDELYEAIEKLAHYEDLEEQGRLITLPCKFGEDAWFVCKHLIYGEVGDAAEVKWFIEKRQFNFQNYVSHQRMAYATKEEAEAKLKELKGE